MPDWVWGIGIAVAVQGAVLAAQALRHRRRSARLRDGEAVRLRVVLAGAAAPYPRAPRRGTLTLGEHVLRFEDGAGAVVDLTPCGLEVLRVRDARIGEGVREEDVVTVVCRDGLGTPVTLTTDPDVADLVAAALRGRPVPEQPRPAEPSDGRGRPPLGLPAALVAAGGVLALCVALLLSGSTRVTGTVTAVDADGFCRVTWTDPRSGVQRSSGVDCFEEVGERSVVVALGRPFVGEVVDTDTPWIWSFLAGGLSLGGVALGGRLLLLRRRRRGGQAPFAGSSATARPARVASLTAADLRWDGVAAAALARAAAEGWLRTDGAARGRVRRRLLAGLAGTAVVPLVAVGVALPFAWTSFAGVLARTGPTEQVVARTGELVPGLPVLAPDDLEVRFTTLDGRRVTTLVAVRGLPDPVPPTLEVAYSRARPERAVAVVHAGDVRGAAVGAVVLLGAAGGYGWWVAPLLLSGRRQRRARDRGSRTPVRYAAFLADSGDVVLVLSADGLPGGTSGRPGVAVVLSPGAEALLPGASGAAVLHGEATPGGTVALTTLARGTEVLVPLGSPLLEQDEEELLLLVNGGDDLAHAPD